MSVANRVEKLCRRYGDGELDELPEAASSALARILTLVRDGKAPEADDALVRDLDIIEAVLVTRLDGFTVATRGFRPLTGMAGHPVAYVAGCPAGACSRRVIRTTTDGEPLTCGITEQPLEFTRLPT
jgi:hypothetical protein